MTLPELSLLLVTPYEFDSLRQTVRHAEKQSRSSEMELVFVVPSAVEFGLDRSATEGFHSVRVVEVGPLRSNAHGYAEGVRAASAGVVVFCEDHCYPAAGWAEALIDRHREPWAVVAPNIAHANQPGVIAWADFLLGYGPWLDPTPAGELDYLPGHNSAYKRDRLLDYGDDLERWLEAESVLHWDLRRRGERLWIEPAARAHHFSFSRMAPYLSATFHTARTFSSRRLRERPWPLRWAYALASPMIPLVRFRRCWRDLRRSAEKPSLLALSPPLFCALGVSALGEAIGALFGPGRSPAKVSDFEFRRDRHVRRADREAMRAAAFWS